MQPKLKIQKHVKLRNNKLADVDFVTTIRVEMTKPTATT